MSIKSSANFGGLTSDKVRAALFYSRKRRLLRKSGVDAITGTPPSLDPLSDSDQLSVGVTWGTYDDSDVVTRQMKLNSGQWVPYVGTTVVNEDEVWTVRENVELNGVNRIFTSNFQQVTA